MAIGRIIGITVGIDRLANSFLIFVVASRAADTVAGCIKLATPPIEDDHALGVSEDKAGRKYSCDDESSH